MKKLKCVETGKIQHFPLRAESRKREARQEMFSVSRLVTRRSILGPSAEGRPGPSTNKVLHIEYRSSSLALTPIGLNQDQLSSIMRQQG